MNKEKLLKKLTFLDFMAVDLAMYCDTHPTDAKAIKTYNDIIKEADKVRCEFENLYGPLCSYRSKSKDEWTWIDNPWPWQSQFNFDLCEGR